jgi:hypothetical protein
MAAKRSKKTNGRQPPKKTKPVTGHAPRKKATKKR